MKVWLLFIFIAGAFLSGCNSVPGEQVASVNQNPGIEPDYSNITLPVNIAPLNFKIHEDGDSYYVKIVNEKGESIGISGRSDGIITFPVRKWNKWLHKNTNSTITYYIYVEKDGEWKEFQPFINFVSESKISPYLYYRLLYPGYESWSEISIMQRNLENFKGKTVVYNEVADENCVNCHSFNQKNTDNFMFHMRGSLGGTYFLKDGDLEKFNLKTKEMQNGAVYPRWHPSGNYVAFASNKIVQQFHAMDKQKIEVSDLNSSLVLFDVQANEMLQIPVDPEHKFMDTYPEWSPAGDYLYFCRSAQAGDKVDYRDIKYNLYRVHFNASNRSFSEPECVFDAEAIDKSVSFPRVSPDGKQLVFTLHDYGCFPIWHKEADLYTLNLDSLSVKELQVNSDFTESYHSWSSNGKWIVFSSKRLDGLTARPYISFVSAEGQATKPFVLPQKDPEFYSQFLKTFNIPEFADAEISFTPGEIRKAANKEAIGVKWSTK